MAGVTQRRRRRRRRRRDSHPPPPLLLLPPPSPLPSPTPPPPPAAVERCSSLDIEAASDHDKIAVVAPSSSAAMGWNLAEASVDASPPPATVDAWRDGSVLTLNAEPKSYYRRPYSSVYDSLETLMQVCRETLRLVKLGKAMPWLKKPLIVSPTAMIVKPSPFARRLKTVYLLRQIHLWSKRNH